MLSNKRNLQIGAVLSYTAIILNVILGIFYTPWMIRQIGQSDYGIYNLAMSIIAMFAMDFGLGQAVSKFMSKYKAMGEEEQIPPFLGAVYSLYLVITAIMFIALLIMFFLLQNIYVKLTPEEIERLKVVYVIAGLFSVVSFPFQPFNGILISEQKFIFAKAMDMITKVLTVVVVIILLTFNQGLYGLVLANAGVGLLVILIKFIYIRYKLHIKPKFGKPDFKLIKSIFSFSIFVMIISITNMLTRSLMPSILGFTSGTAEIATYSIANTIIGYCYMIRVALDGMFLPKVTEFVVDNDYDSLNKLALKIGKIQMIIVGCIVTVFIGCGQEFINLWVGPDFSKAYLCIALVLITTYITATQTIGKTILTANENVKVLANTNIIYMIIAFSFSIGLSYIYGALGVFIGLALANTIAEIIINSIMFSKKAKLNMKSMYKEIQFKNLPAIIITLALCYVAQKYIPTNSLLIFFIKCALLAIPYLILSILCLLDKNQRKGLMNKIFGNNIKDKDNINNNHIYSFDLIRVIAVLFVFCAHTTTTYSDWGNAGKSLYNFIKVLAPLAVPIFFMLSGFLYNRKKGDTKAFWKNKFKKIIVPWMILGSLVCLLQTITNSESVLYFFEALVGLKSIYWYLCALIIMFALYKISNKTYFDVFMILGSLIFMSFNTFNVFNIRDFVGSHAYDWWYPLFNVINCNLYFSVGRILKKYDIINKIKRHNFLVLIVNSALWIAITIPLVIYRGQYYYGYYSLILIPYVLVSFLGINAMGNYIGHWLIWKYPSKFSYAIYLVHMMPLQFIAARIPLWLNVIWPIIFLIIITTCFWVAKKVLCKLKLDKFAYMIGV